MVLTSNSNSNLIANFVANLVKRARLYWWLLGPLVALLVFLPSLTIYFIGEDFVFLHFALSGEPFYKPAQALFYRPLPNLLWQADLFFWQLQPAGYHLTNLILHIANTLLVGLVAYRLTQTRFVGSAAALFFALHPLHVEPVVWLSGRPDLLGTLFFLGALTSWLVYLEKQAKFFYFATLAAYALSLLCKESAIGLPLILIFLTFFGAKNFYPASKISALLLFLPYLAVVGGYITIRLLALGTLGGYPSDGRELFYIAWNLTAGLWLPLFFPFNLESLGWLPLLILASGLLLLYFLAALGLKKTARELFRKNQREIILAILISYITILPALVAAPVTANLAQSRILYLPSLGFCLLLAILLGRGYNRTAVPAGSIYRSGRPLKIILALGLIYFVSLLAALLPWWQAGQLVKTTFESLETKKAQIQNGETIYYQGLPDSWKGAYVWRNGLNEATKILINSQAVGIRRTPELLVDYRNSDKGRIWFINYDFDSEQLKIKPTFSYNLTTNSADSGKNSVKSWNFLDCQLPDWKWNSALGSISCQNSRGLLFDNQSQKTDFKLSSPAFTLTNAASTLELTAYAYYDFQQLYIFSKLLLVDADERIFFEQDFEIVADGKNHHYNLELPANFSPQKPVRAIISIKDVRNNILWQKISLTR